MHRKRCGVVVLGLGLALSVAGCGKPYRFVDAPTVPEADVINGLKCEIATFLAWAKQQKRPGRVFFSLDPAQVADVELTLKTTTQRGAGVSAVLAFAGGSIVPAIGASVQESETLTGTTSFFLQQRLEPKQVSCIGLPGDRPGIGLFDWLKAKFETEDTIRAGSPRAGLRSLVATTDFGVKRDVEGKVSFVPLSVTPSAFYSSDDVQSLKVTFRGHHASPGAPERAGGPNVKRDESKEPKRKKAERM